MWKSGLLPSRYSLTIVKVGLLTGRLIPKALAIPLVNVVFPAPKSPDKSNKS